MVESTETHYKSTNRVVITLIVLVALVLGYLLVAYIRDHGDDDQLTMPRESSVTNQTAGEPPADTPVMEEIEPAPAE